MGYNYHLEVSWFADGYANYGEPVRAATEEDAKGLLKKIEQIG